MKMTIQEAIIRLNNSSSNKREDAEQEIVGTEMFEALVAIGLVSLGVGRGSDGRPVKTYKLTQAAMKDIELQEKLKNRKESGFQKFMNSLGL
jgi:predicted ArsR family transcriptional regulator